MDPFPTEPTPLSLEPERAFLGGILTEPSQLLRFQGDVAPDHFHRPDHAALYRLLLEMAELGNPIDSVTVCERVMFLGPDRFGGTGYVAELPEHCPSTVAMRGYAAAIVEHHRVRRLRAIAEDLVTAANGRGPFGTLPAGEIADEWVPRLSEVSLVRGGRKHIATFGEALRKAEDQRLDREAGAVGPQLETGYDVVDELLGGGPRGGQLIVIGGVSSMGKTGLAVGFLGEMARAGGRFLYFTLEMPREDMALRLASYLTSIPHELLRTGELTPEQEYMRDDLLAGADDWGVDFVDKGRVSMKTVVSESRAAWSTGALRAVFIDHLHLMSHGRADNRTQAIGETTARCKALAMELGVPVFLLAQLNRGDGSDKRQPRQKRRTSDDGGGWWESVSLPTLDRLRDSGAIEQDADVVLFPVHALRFGLKDQPTDGAVVVAKQRNGPTGVVGVRWDGPCSCYRPYGAANPKPR